MVEEIRERMNVPSAVWTSRDEMGRSRIIRFGMSL